MKNYHYILLIFIFLTFQPTCAQNQTKLGDELTTALEQADNNKLATYLSAYLIVNMKDQPEVISSLQAKQELGIFFEKHPLKVLKLIDQGNNKSQQFFIWKYMSESNSWRFYFLLTTEEKIPRIHQIDIEKTN